MEKTACRAAESVAELLCVERKGNVTRRLYFTDGSLPDYAACEIPPETPGGCPLCVGAKADAPLWSLSGLGNL